MRYCLVINYNNEVREISSYSKIPGFEYLKEDTIKDIVSFTNLFDNEYDLIDYLIETELIPSSLVRGNVNIAFYKSEKSEPKILSYGVSFKSDKKYFDTIFLQYYFGCRLSDMGFMKEFINTYYYNLKDVSIFRNSLDHIYFSYKFYKQNSYLPEEAAEAMERFVRLYCTKKGKDGHYKADFSKIRELAMFAIDFERKNHMQPEEKPQYSIRQVEATINHYKLLLEEGYITEEQAEAYCNEIVRLEEALDVAYKKAMNRSKKHGSTTN